MLLMKHSQNDQFWIYFWGIWGISPHPAVPSPWNLDMLCIYAMSMYGYLLIELEPSFPCLFQHKYTKNAFLEVFWVSKLNNSADIDGEAFLSWIIHILYHIYLDLFTICLRCEVGLRGWPIYMLRRTPRPGAYSDLGVAADTLSKTYSPGKLRNCCGCMGDSSPNTYTEYRDPRWRIAFSISYLLL